MDRGAHFYKTDFQVHTPRDLNWKGDGAVSEDERRAFAREFVSECRKRGLGAVAITDHHDVAFFPYIKRAAAEETDGLGQPLPPERRLIVFPGMELTLGVPCQALLLLDADFPEGLLGTVATALAVDNKAEPGAAKHGPIVRLEHIKTLSELCGRLDQQTHLVGKYILLPHVGESGVSLLRKGFASHYKDMPCVGGYVDGDVSQHGVGNRDILQGRVKEWGNKALGVFQTSDNRRRDFADLGVHHTWVKWARPTAEALRQACLARHSRISQAEPALPTVRITRLEVSNSKFLGPFQVEWNGQCNALIGGRGTGKSSVLEYLRWGLCDQPPRSTDDELADYQQRRASLIDKTLRPLDGNVQVTVVANDTEHLVRRHVDGRLLLKVGAGEFRAVTEQDVRALLPIQAYSQKQLSSVGIKSEELRRFIHLPIQVKLDAVGSRLNDAASRIRGAHDATREFRRVSKEKTTALTELSSIEQQLAGLRKGLKGVSEADRQVISAQPRWAAEARVVARWRKEVAQLLADVRQLRDRCAAVPGPRGDEKFNDEARLSELENLVRALSEEARVHLSSAERAIAGPSDASERLVASAKAWDAAYADNLKRYEDAKGRAAESEVALKQIGILEARQAELASVVAQHDRRLLDLGDPEQAYRHACDEWRALHSERTGLLRAQCDKLSELSKGLLRAMVRSGAGTSYIAAYLKEVAKGTKMRTEKFDQLLLAIAQEPDPVAAWLGVVAEFRALSEMDDFASGVMPPCPRLGSAQITESDRRKLAERVASRGWAELATMELSDVPVFEYRAREGEYIDFSDASAGQQATALMFVLLNQDGPPLVIDQPEDDLDNHVIQKVVEEVWNAKSRRQLIFTSHNANLVVNGDAELVVCCDYRTVGDQSGGMIKTQGAIDVDDVRAEIATVMEGGKEAFTLRQAKYGF